MTTESIIRMEAVNKWYGEFQVLTGIDLSVRQGERIVICGPSGSGKSTLIRCINRLETVQKGRIVVDGIDLTAGGKNVDAVRAEVGMRPGMRATAVGLRIGALAGVDGESLRFGFDCLVKDSEFDPLRLEIDATDGEDLDIAWLELEEP